MKDLKELQRNLKELGLDDTRVAKLLLTEMLNQFKSGILSRDQFMAAGISLGLIKVPAVLEVTRADAKILDHAKAIIVKGGR